MAEEWEGERGGESERGSDGGRGRVEDNANEREQMNVSWTWSMRRAARTGVNGRRQE